MLNTKDIKLKTLCDEQNQDIEFKLVWITDISTKQGNNSYQLIFESLNTENNFYITEELPPELLNNYIINNHYLNCKELGKNNLINEQITIRPSESKILKIKDTPNRNDNKSAITQIYSERIGEQYASVCKYNGYYLIIPCHVIGSAFYFTSTTMRKRIFDSKIEALYHKVGIEEGCPYVILKTGVPDSDAEFVYFYATNEHARTQWYAIKNNLYAEKKVLESKAKCKGYVPLKIDFPFMEPVDINILGIKEKKNKRIIVLKILDFDKPKAFGFSEVTPKRYSKKIKRKENTDAAAETIFRTKTQDTGILEQRDPSYRNQTRKVVDDTDDNKMFPDIIVRKKEIIYKDGEKLSEGYRHNNVFITNPEKTDISFNTLRDGGNSGIRPVEMQKAEDNYFTFNDFRELMKMFKDKYSSYIKENSSFIASPAKFPVERKKKRYRKKESYDTKNLRDYITARFVYINNSAEKHVLIVELDQKSSVSGFSTFIFINESDINNNQAKDFLRKYAVDVNFSKIQKVFEKQGIKLIRKNHPEKGNKNKTFKSWCEDLIKKLKAI